MAKLNLTAERLRELLHYDPETGIFTWLPYTGKNGRINAGDTAGCKTTGKILIGIGGSIWRAHRLAWLYMTGKWPQDVIDHIDGNPHNNKWHNLRDVSHSVNMQNIRVAKSNNRNGVLGVERHGLKWRASIKTGDKRWRSGVFQTKEEAHAAYLIAKREAHTGCTI